MLLSQGIQEWVPIKDIYSFNRHLLNTHYKPFIDNIYILNIYYILGTGDTVVSQIDKKIFALTGLNSGKNDRL